MKKPKLSTLAKTARSAMSKHSPQILTGIGIAGMITTTVLAVRATPRALEIIEEEKIRRYKETDDESITKVEIVKTCWKCYIPTVITGALSVSCLIGGMSVSTRRTAALAAAYQLSERAFTEYKEKMIDTIGEKRVQTVKDKIAEDRLQKNPVSKSEIVVTNKGETLCLDPISGRYFKSDIERIKKAENVLNKQMLHDITGYVALNEFYDELGLDHTSIGDDLGWNVNNLIDMDFTSQIADNGTPCIVLDYQVAPKYDYYKCM